MIGLHCSHLRCLIRQRKYAFMIEYSAIVWLFLSGAGAFPVEENKQFSQDSCGQHTYYIHEYHNHASTNQTEVGLPPHVTSSAAGTESPFKSNSARWTSIIENLEGELLVEKNKRIEQLTDFLKWMRIMSKGETGTNRKITAILDDIKLIVSAEKESRQTSKKRVTVLQRPSKLQEDKETQKEALNSEGWSPVEDVQNNVLKQDSSSTVDGKKKKETEDGEEVHDGGLMGAVEALQEQMKSIKRNVKEAKRRYLHLFKQNRRMNTKHQDLLQKHDRLKMYQATDMQQLRWRVGNETELLRAGYKKMEAKLTCAMDPSSSVDCSPPGSTNHVMASPPHVGEYREAKGRGQEVVNIEDVVTSSPVFERPKHLVPASNVAGDDLVAAGQQVSKWYLEQQRAERPKDCGDIDFWVQRESPIQTVYMKNRTQPVRVKCKEGWTIIYDYTFDTSSNQKPPLYEWQDYKFGYGALGSNVMWMGLEYLHWLSKQDDYFLQIDMIQAHTGYAVTASYAFFDVASEKDWYRLQVSDYSGSSGDILGVSAQVRLTHSPFSSYEHHSTPSLGKLANEFKAGWWYADNADNPYSVGRRHNKPIPSPCFTHLLYEMPWYCNAMGSMEHVSHITMKVIPSNKT